MPYNQVYCVFVFLFNQLAHKYISMTSSYPGKSRVERIVEYKKKN